MFVPFETAAGEDSSAGLSKIIDRLTQMVFMLLIPPSTGALGLHFAHFTASEIANSVVSDPTCFVDLVRDCIYPYHFILPPRYTA